MSAKKKIMLESDPKSCWEVYSSAKHKKAMDKTADGYVDFLSRCKTEREVIEYALEKVKQAGFKDDFKAEACYRVNRGKTLFLARKGRKGLAEGFRLVGAHADSPRIDFKQHPLYEDVSVGLAKTHYYGGIRKHQWLARPLALHGVVVKKDGTVVEVVVGEDASDPVMTISDLLPHLAYKQVEQKLKNAFDAEKLNVVLGHAPSESKDKDKKDGDKNRVKLNILEILNKKYGIVEDDLYSAELQMVPAGPCRYVGLDSSMIGGYGHDDRSCVYSALEAFLAEDDPEYTQVVLFWDKEEIGSDGATGAKSLFFEYSMEDLLETWNRASSFPMFS